MEMAQRGELAQLEAHVKDMQSARDREVQIATSANAPTLNKIVTPVLALGTVSLSFVLFAVILFVPVDQASKYCARPSCWWLAGGVAFAGIIGGRRAATP